MRFLGHHNLLTRYGRFVLYGFEQSIPSEIIVALKRSNPKNIGPWVVRIQYGCLTGTAFHSLDCDCARQLDYSMQRIAKIGRGVVLYFPNREANGAGLAAKIRINARNVKTVPALRATAAVRAATELKRLRVVKRILRRLRITEPIRLLTNNPQKVAAVENAGIKIGAVIHFKIRETDLSPSGERELRAKRSILGHWNP